MNIDEIYQQADTASRQAEAATAFLAALRPDQQAKTQHPFDDETVRKDWHYIPRDRAGLPLKEMEAHQREKAFNLVDTGLGEAARLKARTIISLEPILAQIEGTVRRFPRDPELYHMVIFGTPGGADPWSWRFEGHHISLNYTVVNGCMVAPTPTFFGANPAQVRHGEREGLRALEEEEDLGRDLLASLDGDQKRVAIIQADAPSDILTRNTPQVGDDVTPEGLSGKDMTPGQRETMQALVNVYINRLPGELAETEHGKLKAADPLGIHFAWAGAEERNKGHYYRVQGPTFLAEYDNTQNDANHIHSVWRDLTNDFGEDVLRQHYRQSH